MHFLRVLLVLAVFLSAVAGCRQDDEIKQETITHDDREPIHLRVAIMRHADKVWFFRLDGPELLVNEHLANFDAFVKSVRFTGQANAPITWTEPSGWKKVPGVKEPNARFRIEAKKSELEVKVTALSAKGFQMMENMHRWQRQVNRPLSEDVEDYEQYITREKSPAIDEIIWVSMTGLAVHTVSKAAEPMAGDEKDPQAPMLKKSGGKVPFKFTVPSGWVQKPPRELLLDVYEITDSDKSAEVTLSTARGDPAANINRWRDQVGLPAQSPDEIAKSIQPLLVAGIKSYYADLANPNGPPAKNRTLGVIVPSNRAFFFIKMSGPHDIVGRHKQAFETFVASFRK